MKRIARLLSIVVMPLGAMLSVLPGRALAATQYPDGGYHPMGTIVRCDMAAFMHRMYVKGLV